MQAVVFAIHLIVSLALVGVILLQRSEGGALGIGGGNNAMVSGRGAASLLTRTTAILAGLFFATSLTLAALASIQKKHDVLDLNVPVSSAPAPSAPLTIPAPVTTEPAAPAIPAPTPEKSSALELAPKVSSAAAAPEAKTPAKTPAKAAAAPAAKPSIPEPTAETAPAPAGAGPTTSGGNDAGDAGGGAAGPQPR